MPGMTRGGGLILGVLAAMLIFAATASAQSFREFTTANAGSQPLNITTGPDGALWFTEGGAGSIGRIATDGTISTFPIPRSGATPEDITASGQERARVEQALASLPEAHRSVLLLYYGQDLTSREVADILGCDDQQIRSRLSYARRLLRQELDLASKVVP